MWSDIFYPGNPEKRKQLIEKNQALKDYMKNNFRATNQLIDVMKEHLSCSFEHITLDENATLGKNCDVMIECMHKIQAEVEKIDKKLKEMLDPDLYEKLKKMSLTLSLDEFKGISKAIEEVCAAESVQATIIMSILANTGEVFAGIASTLATVAATAVACVGLAVVFLGIDMIVEAILGSIERDHLEKALKEYDTALATFGPASEVYQDKITYVKIKIEEIKEFEIPV